jgi:pilus assembly protein Flp/PilA
MNKSQNLYTLTNNGSFLIGVHIIYFHFVHTGELIILYLPREEGQGLVEYALILVLVAVVVIVILALLGPAIGNIFSNIVRSL